MEERVGTTTSKKQPYDVLFKVVTVGNSGAGKTSLIYRFVNDGPMDQMKPTVGVEFSSKFFTKEDGKVVKAQLWDTAGNERYQSVTSSYFRGSVAACVVYDITDFQSFKKVAFWLKEIKQHCNENIVIMLIGNKSDIAEQRQVDKLKAAEYAAQHQIGFMETSAFDGSNV